jgi:hypothetical protein
VKRPCSQSRNVATGVSIRFANAVCVRPDFSRAFNTRICSGVVTRPTIPFLASLSACRKSGRTSPASASMAFVTASRSIFLMPMSHRLFNLGCRDVASVGLGVYRYEQHNLRFGQVKVNNARAAGFTCSRTAPAYLSRSVGAGNYIASLRIGRHPGDELQSFIFRP